MKKVVIGYLYAGPILGKDEYAFKRIAKKLKIDLILFDIFDGPPLNIMKEAFSKCDIFFNNSAEEFSFEIEKTIEELGKPIIDTSQSYYVSEDKWVFYLMCKDHNIPPPETILLSEKLDNAKKELNECNRWPVVLKRVSGTMGEFVERANDIKESITILEKFWKKGSQRLPVIAQELVISPCYRVTVINGKIVQSIMKNAKGWKKTGVFEKRNKRFFIDIDLKKIIKTISSFSKIKVLGIDFLKKGNKWIALEVNSAPAFDFIESDRDKIIKKVLIFLKKEALKTN